MLVIQVCTFLVFWDLGYKIEFLCVLVKLEMRGQTVSYFLEVWEPITNLLDSKRCKSKRWFTLSVNDILTSKYVAVSYDSSFLEAYIVNKFPKLYKTIQ